MVKKHYPISACVMVPVKGGPFVAYDDYTALQAENERLLAMIDGQAAQRPLIARQLAEWHEDDGPAMWWAWCGSDWAGEPAWCGTPNDSDWPGYHTHWTPHPAWPMQPSNGEGE